MTASEQQAEYAEAARTLAHSVTDSVGSEQRAAIEADVLRRVADQSDGWITVTELRAEADRIEGGAR